MEPRDYMRLVKESLNSVAREYRYFREVEIVDRIREEINRRVIKLYGIETEKSR